MQLGWSQLMEILTKINVRQRVVKAKSEEQDGRKLKKAN